MIRIYHYNSLTEAERMRLNSPGNDWDSEPRFARYASITGFGGAKPELILYAWRKNEYSPVAEVDTDDLEEAFMLTNHIDRSWTENEGVEVLSDRTRSSSVGDIFKKGDDYYAVAGMGFEKLDNLRLYMS